MRMNRRTTKTKPEPGESQMSYRAVVMLLVTFGTLGCRSQIMSRIRPSAMPSGSPLATLALPHTGRAMHEGSWDRSGGNADMRRVEPGQTITLLDHQGAGDRKSVV